MYAVTVTLAGFTIWQITTPDTVTLIRQLITLNLPVAGIKQTKLYRPGS